jgi:hypothetical protein
VLSNGVAPKDKSTVPSMGEALAAGQTLNENMMSMAIDWAEKQKPSSQWSHLDLTRIAAGGQSCGGLEAAVMALNRRVTTIGIFNSGLRIAQISKAGAGKSGLGALMGKGMGGLPIPNGGKIPDGSAFKVPTFFFLGGPSDVSGAKVRRYTSPARLSSFFLGNADRGV